MEHVFQTRVVVLMAADLCSSYAWLFWPILGFTVYMAVGPWVVGHLIEDRTGAIFAWGAVVAGTFIPVQVGEEGGQDT